MTDWPIYTPGICTTSSAVLLTVLSVNTKTAWTEKYF